MRNEVHRFVGESTNRYKAYDVANREAKRRFGWGGYRVLSDILVRPRSEGGTVPGLTKWRVILTVIATKDVETTLGERLTEEQRTNLGRVGR